MYAAIQEIAQALSRGDALGGPAGAAARAGRHGWLSREALGEVADALELTPAYCYSVAWFYDLFRLEPVGAHPVEVCTNVSCGLVNAQRFRLTVAISRQSSASVCGGPVPARSVKAGGTTRIDEVKQQMAKSHMDQQGLEKRISDIAQSFARGIVTVLGSATVEELLGLSSARASTFRPGASAFIAPIRRKRSWPTCGESGCKNAYYPASGTARLCYKHFLASGGKHPSKAK